ncbi:6-phosphogluconolactonase [Brachybacterium sp. AOP43-C2-M15]|uniref:6-phosphogluconolactonase n=1 Tax=Brachybacterium sp. AOP43-C2-M15 TaxID=3457661 RepID=UPI0040332463
MSPIAHATRPRVVVSAAAQEAGSAAGRAAADALAGILSSAERARVVFASAPSQEQMLRTLGEDPRLDWTRVDSFHMDDYLGLDPAHPAAFGTWLADRLPAEARPGLDRIRADADPAEEAARYGAALAAAPIDLVCLGIGVNGHIAFNEPGDTDFGTSDPVRLVALTEASRRQQVDEGLFPEIEAVPTTALTLTVPALISARTLVCTVLGEAKAAAVAATLAGPVRSEVPATAMLEHPDVVIHLDEAAASTLPEELRATLVATRG